MADVTGLARFDRLNVIAAEKVAVIAVTEGFESAVSEYRKLAKDAYRASVEEARASLRRRIDEDEDEFEELYFLEFAGLTAEDKLLLYTEENSPSDIVRLVDSELHRIYNGGVFGAAGRSGLDFTRQWITREDERVRDTHVYLHGVKVRGDEPFATFDGDTAMYPGGFSKAENNVNCRCVISISPA